MNREVHREIAELVRTMHQTSRDGDALAETLKSITEGAVRYVPGARYAGVLQVNRKKEHVSFASTDPMMEKLDDIQMESGQGPCLEAAWREPMVRIDDMEIDDRWPIFSGRAVRETPARSSLSFQLFTHQGAMGALNLFSEEKNAFTTESDEIGLIYATHAALALFRTQQEDQFHSALASRDIIGQAKGMIMERFTVDAVQAFELLRRLSQDSNTPLARVAQQIIDSEQLGPA